MSDQSYPASQARSYLYFRIFIGCIGIAFPFVLLVGQKLLEGSILNAISDYNYSLSMRNVFVGGLVALGMLLIAYQYARVDNVVTTIAGLCAMGVAFFPEAPATSPTHGQKVIGIFHLVFAASFFVILAYIALFLFTKSAALDPTARKRQRNQVYRVCGGVIIACIVLLLSLLVVSVPAWIDALHPVYWLETVAVVAFGAAWIVKGELLLRDDGAAPDPIQRTFATVQQVFRPSRVTAKVEA